MRDDRRRRGVIKYGSPIGVATATIPPGAHVHTHNVASARGRGDLAPHRACGSERCRRDSPSRPTIGGTRERRRRVRVPGLPPAGRARRRAQPSAGRADGDLLVGRGRARRRGGRADRHARCRTPPGAASSGPTWDTTHETLAAYCGHPNVGAVLVIALGCEQVVAQHLADAARRAGQARADHRDPERGRHRPHDRARDRDRAGAGGRARAHAA